MSEQLKRTDRRRFFRISDQIGISYRVLDDVELSQVESLGKPIADLPLLTQYDNKISELLKELGETNPVLAELLDTMDKKFNCVIQQLELESSIARNLVHGVREVNISACGLALDLDERLPERAVVELQLSLQSKQALISCYGVVVEVAHLQESDEYHTRIDYCGMTTRDQESLIQHIVQRQSQLLSEERKATSL